MMTMTTKRVTTYQASEEDGKYDGNNGDDKVDRNGDGLHREEDDCSSSGSVSSFSLRS